MCFITFLVGFITFEKIEKLKKFEITVCENFSYDDYVSVREKQSFNIYKPQVRGASLSARDVVRRELGFQIPELTKASQVRQNLKDRK